ncbi:alpha/beta fold hydrolase [Nocardioides pacificus]
MPALPRSVAALVRPVMPQQIARRRVYLPWVPIPQGRMVELPGRGSTYVTDTPGPSEKAPTIVLLHAVGCTGLLTWFPAIKALSERYRVITLDQRWHGRGIHSPTFSLYDCADDVAALLDVLEIEEAVIGGYSMGSIIAQRVWRQHPDRTAGLVLCASTAHFRTHAHERAFHAGVELAMVGARGISTSRTAVRASRSAAQALGDVPDDLYEWALAEFRQTSPWAVATAVAALGRHHSRPWLARIDAPTAVVATRRDRVIPFDRQLALARLIPGATVHDIDAGHAACTIESELFVPALLEATATVVARGRDFSRRRTSGRPRPS